MAVFFFHFFDGTELAVDETGLELANVELAYLEARATALQMWPELVTGGLNPLQCYFEIANLRGEALLRFAFSELIETGAGSAALRPSPSLEIMSSSIATTHRRARQAKEGLEASLGDARKSLEEVKKLIAQIVP